MPITLTYTVQRPGGGAAILNAHRELSGGAAYDRFTGLFAFASVKGARLLADAVGQSPSWQNAVKRWVISIDGGITEPNALRFLLALPHSELRVPYGEELLAAELRPVHRFHPKTVLLERNGPAPVPSAMMVGSANLTCNGLCFGHEHAISVRAAADDPLPATVMTGLAHLEEVATWAPVIDAAFIDRYQAIRPAAPVLPEVFEDERAELILQDAPVIQPVQSAALAAASHMWIDIEYVVANRGTEQEGNQIDLQRGARVFFGFGDRELTRNSPIGTVVILYGAHSATRNMRFGNNSMDKLDLPIPGDEGPPSYADKTLLFSREGPGRFRLTVGTPDQVAEWKARSHAAGTAFSMRSGREFGVF